MPSLGWSIIYATAICQLQFSAKIYTVRFVAWNLSKICSYTLKCSQQMCL